MHPLPLILALDAGGSSTRCVLARADGTVLARVRTGPGNHILCGWEVARASIAAAVEAACAAAGVEPVAVACAVAGSAGVGPNGEGREVVESLLAERMPCPNISAVGDMVTAFWGALDVDCGVVVAAGTGSVCYGRSTSGASCQVGGWGQIMGDEGSAYDIAVRALRAGARATDGRGPATTLTAVIAKELGAGGFMEVAFRVYGDPMTREAIAALAPIVCQAAAAGDPLARELLASAGEELASAAVTALRKLDLADTPTAVAYTGAVFDAGELIVGSFRTAVMRACPLATVVPAAFPPVIGAFKLGLRALDLPFTSVTAGALRTSWATEHA